MCVKSPESAFGRCVRCRTLTQRGPVCKWTMCLTPQNITARDERQWPAGCRVAGCREPGSSAGLEQFAQVVNHQRRLLLADIFAVVVTIGQRHTGHSGGAGGQHVIA